MSSTRYYKYNHLELSNGNLKLGNDTLILNITSATDCPSARLGLCQLHNPKQCYALKAEKMYPGCLPYRRRQAEYWDATPWNVIAKDFIALFKRFPSLSRIKYIRINESGDFRDQNDIYQLNTIAYAVNNALRKNLIWYGYSARSDLDFSQAENLLIKGSGHLNGNNGRVIVRKLDKALKGKTISIEGFVAYVCPGKCHDCSFCKRNIGQTLLVIPQH